MMVGLDVDEYNDDDSNDGVDEADDNDDDAGRALVETEPVRYQLEEIQLTLDKEDSEKVIFMMMMMTTMTMTMTITMTNICDNHNQS